MPSCNKFFFQKTTLCNNFFKCLPLPPGSLFTKDSLGLWDIDSILGTNPWNAEPWHETCSKNPCVWWLIEYQYCVDSLRSGLEHGILRNATSWRNWRQWRWWKLTWETWTPSTRPSLVQTVSSSFHPRYWTLKSSHAGFKSFSLKWSLLLDPNKEFARYLVVLLLQTSNTRRKYMKVTNHEDQSQIQQHNECRLKHVQDSCASLIPEMESECVRAQAGNTQKQSSSLV